MTGKMLLGFHSWPMAFPNAEAKVTRAMTNWRLGVSTCPQSKLLRFYMIQQKRGAPKSTNNIQQLSIKFTVFVEKNAKLHRCGDPAPVQRVLGLWPFGPLAGLPLGLLVGLLQSHMVEHVGTNCTAKIPKHGFQKGHVLLNFSWMPSTHTHTIADNGSPLCTVLYRWKSFSTFQRCQSLKQQPILVEGAVAICSNTALDALECFGTL